MRWHVSCYNSIVMSEETPKFDARLAKGVSYFEQMLQLMPEDRTTLEFLVVAYDQLNEHEKGEKALVSLARILIKERDVAALEGLLPRLEKSENPEAKILVLRVKTIVAPAPDLTPEMPKVQTEEDQVVTACARAVMAELALVDVLVEGGVLSAEDADAVRSSLQGTPFDGRLFLISALSILEKENLPRFEKAVAYLADKFNVPPIPLAAFDPHKTLVSKFPVRTIRLRGAIPFAELGTSVLVAVLNPMDERMRDLMNAVAPCRFFMADPATVEAMIEKLFKQVETKK